MDFREYTKFTDTTAVYPNPDTDLTYPTLGLVDEVAELYTATHDNVVKELGDVCYYLARLNRALNINLVSVIDSSNKKANLTEYELVELMVVDAGYIAGRLKKYIRGDYDRSELLNSVYPYIVGMLSTMGAVAKLFNLTIEEVMQINKDKLTSRKERGVLKGDGDNR